MPKHATETYVDNKVTTLIASAPGALDTLDELAAALGDDANFATTVTNSLALKAPLASPTFTGTVTVPTPSGATDAASKGYVDTAAGSARTVTKTVAPIGTAADYNTDGTADQTEINNAITAVNAAGGGVVYLRAGTYTTSGSIIMLSNVTLQGEGMGVTKIVGGGTDYSIINTTKSGTTKTVYANLAVNDLTVTSNYGTCIAIFNTTGLVLAHTELTHATKPAIRQGFFATHCNSVEIHDNYVHDYAGNGISVTATNNFNIYSNRIFTGRDDGIDVDFDFLDTSAISSNHGTIQGNVISSITNGTGIRVENSSYVTVSGNEINNITNDVGAIGGLLINTTLSNTGKDISVIGNVVTDCVSSGIQTFGTGLSNVTVTGNTVDNCGQTGGVNQRGGIVIGSAGINCFGNVVNGTTRTGTDTGGIMLYKFNSIVTNNTVTNCTTGIRTWNADGLQSYATTTIAYNQTSSNTTNYALSGTTNATNIEIPLSGNLGIGTATPDDMVHLARADATNPITLKVQNIDAGGAGDAEIFLGTSSTLTNVSVGASIYADRTNTGGAGSTDLLFKNSSGTTLNTNMTIKADGKVGIGKTPSTTLDVNGTITGTAVSTATVSAATRLVLRADADSSNMMAITKANGSTVMARFDSSSLRMVIGSGAAPHSTLQTDGSFATMLAAKTAAYTLTPTDATVTGDTTAGAFNITLPTAIGITGRIYTIKRISAGANNLTLATTSSQTIDGATTYVLSAQWELVQVQSDGANWIVIGSN